MALARMVELLHNDNTIYLSLTTLYHVQAEQYATWMMASGTMTRSFLSNKLGPLFCDCVETDTCSWRLLCF
jgi:hypothetical protein